jgi:hypothetical protein
VATGKALAKGLRIRQQHELSRLDALWLGSRDMALTTSGVTQVLRRRAAGRCGSLVLALAGWGWEKVLAPAALRSLMGQCGWAVRPLGKTARRCLTVRTGDGSG